MPGEDCTEVIGDLGRNGLGGEATAQLGRGLQGLGKGHAGGAPFHVAPDLLADLLRQLAVHILRQAL